MSAGTVVRCFLDADLRGGHDWLRKQGKSAGIDLTSLELGQFVMFVNRKKDKLKVYAASNVLAYYRCDKGRHIDMNTIREIPKVFLAKGKVDYDAAIKTVVEKAFMKKYGSVA